MGYDLNRFTEPVDDDFLCPICHDVLENAVESRDCEHVFCDGCIKWWLKINSKCPVDCLPLKYIDCKPISRLLKNILLRLAIKCNFEAHGCQAIITLENLKTHVESCAFDPNLEVKCENQCGLMIAQSEQMSHNCVAYLSSLVTELRKQNLLFIDKIGELQSAQQWVCSKRLSVVYNNIIEWKEDDIGFAQSRVSLSAIKPYFEVKVLDLGLANQIGIGLFNKACNNIEDDDLLLDVKKIIFFNCAGNVYMPYVTADVELESVTEWEIGDTICCGIDYQKSNKQSDAILVYFKRNDELICEQLCKLSSSQALFPTVYLNSEGSKIAIV